MRASVVEKRGHFRRKPRAGRRMAVRFAVVASSGPGGPSSSGGPASAERRDFQSAFTLNIGLGGAFIEMEEPPPPGTLLALELLVPPDGRIVELGAEVRWVAPAATEETPAGMGLRFHGLDEDKQAALTEYFATLAPTVDHDEAP